MPDAKGVVIVHGVGCSVCSAVLELGDTEAYPSHGWACGRYRPPHHDWGSGSYHSLCPSCLDTVVTKIVLSQSFRDELRQINLPPIPIEDEPAWRV